MSNKIVSACPSGNILIFDVVKGKIGKLARPSAFSKPSSMQNERSPAGIIDR
jgi:hypothetical protein